MPQFQTCRAAVVTAAGRGAVATILIQGDGASDLVARFFQPAAARSLGSFAAGRVIFGNWKCDSDHEEQLVVVPQHDGHVEVHCHGGTAAVNAILAGLAQHDCDIVDWQTLLCDRQPSLEQEALLALVQSRTERTAAILLDQHRGALRAEIDRIIELIRASQLADAESALGHLSGTSRLGTHLTAPWRVVMAGRPNVGKSSLINAVLGYSRAIVYDQPGTTRDALTATTAIEGWPIELSDTAGLRDTSDEIESAGVARARRQMERADLILLVSDRVDLPPPELGLPPDCGLLHVTNKIDLASDGRAPAASIGTSAVTGAGIPQLLAAIVRLLVTSVPRPGQAVVFTTRQQNAILAAREHLCEGSAEAARVQLETLVASSLDRP